MLDIEVIDAHHHLCDFTHSYPWLEGPAEPFRYHGDDRPLRRSYLLDDYRTDASSVPLVGSVHIENGAADPGWEADWIEQLHRSQGLPSVQVVKANLLDPKVGDWLSRAAALSTVRGVRDILNWHPDPVYTHTVRPDIVTDAQWLKGFGQLAGLGLSFDLQVFPQQLASAARLAAEHPQTQIVLDHAGMPIGRDAESIGEWSKGMRLLARQENVTVKVSALGTNDHRWTTESLRPIVLETIDIFGPGRTMFGSNFPVDSLYSSYKKLYGAFDEITAEMSSSDRRMLFAETARSFYRIESAGQ